MSRNPYIDVDGYLDDGMGPARGTRTSVLAISSLASSLVCCIPLLGVLSIVMGAASLLLIGKSNGRLTGRGAAIAGLIVGIMTTVIWGAIGAGALQAQRYYIKQMVPVAETAFEAARDGDVAGFRAALSPDADGDLSDERIEAFMGAFDREFGGYQRVAKDWGTLFESFGATYQNTRNQGGNNVNMRNVIPVPVGVVGKDKQRVAWILLDEAEMDAGRVVARDIVVMMGDDECFTLREDGPGKLFAGAMWLDIVELDEVGAEEADDAVEEAPTEEALEDAA